MPAKPVATPALVAPQAAVSAPEAKVDADVVDATATRLGMAWTHTEPKAAVTEASAEAPPPPVKHEGPDWVFLGPIHESDRNLAIISVDGHQKILAEGRTFGDTKLVGVANDGIDVEINGIPKHIDRGTRSGSAVAWVRNLQNNTPAARIGIPGMPGQPNAQNIPPEVRQRLEARGITPDQMQNWRNGRNGGQGGGPGGRNRATPGGGGGGAPNGDLRGGIEMPGGAPTDAATVTMPPTKTGVAAPISVDRRRSVN
jgi:hypothetical protein